MEKPYFHSNNLSSQKNDNEENALQHQHGRGYWVVAAQF